MIDPAFTLCFIERRDADTPSIELVFRCIAEELRNAGVNVLFQKLPFGNNFTGVLWNLAFFSPAPADIYHIAGQVHYIGLKLPPERTVLTVHDLGILKNRGGIRSRIIEWLYFHRPGKRLRHITAVSEFTKKELLSLGGIEPEKITIIENPLVPGLGQKTIEFNKIKPVILQVGTARNKNLVGLIEAIRPLNCRLMIIGRISASDLENLKQAGIEFENRIAVERAELAAAYCEADILAFCSTYEGFGLPIIEAQAVGIPVVTSDLPPMSNVAGGAAVLVDPNNPVAIRKEIERILGDDQLREKLVKAGFENAARFAPFRAALEYMAVYRKIIETVGIKVKTPGEHDRSGALDSKKLL